jgi:ribosomal protein L31
MIKKMAAQDISSAYKVGGVKRARTDIQYAPYDSGGIRGDPHSKPGTKRSLRIKNRVISRLSCPHKCIQVNCKTVQGTFTIDSSTKKHNIKLTVDPKTHKTVFVCDCQKELTTNCKHIANALAQLIENQCLSVEQLTEAEEEIELTEGIAGLWI